MKTFQRAALYASIALGLSCAEHPAPEQASAVAASQEAVRRGLPPDAVIDTRRVCQGAHADRQTCAQCVDNFATLLVDQGRISERQKRELAHLFKKECRDSCVSLTCGQDHRVCGPHTDPCGGPVDCGTCSDGAECFFGACIEGMGPNLQICNCKDGTRLAVCAPILECEDGTAQDAFCQPRCAAHGGNASTGCSPQYPGCLAP